MKDFLRTSLTLSIVGTLLTTTTQARAQDPGGGGSNRPTRNTHQVYRSEAPLQIDAVLDEQAWREADVIKISYEWLPGDNTPAPVDTEVRITYDDNHFYISFFSLDPDPSLIRAHIRDRDAAFTDDHIIFMLDTFNDERRGFQFRVNPMGVQMDASFSELEGIEDWSWDAIWDSEARITGEGYVVEVAVPFSSLRFPRTAEVQTWGIILERSWPRSIRHRIRSSMTDRNLASILAQGDLITGLEGITPGRNIEIDPTFAAIRTDAMPPGGLFSDPPATDLGKGDAETDFGATLKWGIAPNLILNGTVNPDFSQVEADVAQLAVNTRFALFFPERRPFFLEGVDFFATPLNAVFTRTIADPSMGLKLTGKEGRHAIGVFGARDRINNLVFPGNQGSTGDLLDREVDSAVVRYRYDLGSNSTVGLLYTGRSGSDYHNHVAGADGFLRITPTKTLNVQVLYSDTAYPDSLAPGWQQPVGSFNDLAFHANLQHTSNNWMYGGTYQQLGEDFRADTGFLPRVDYRAMSGFLLRQIWGRPDGWFTRLHLVLGSTRTEDMSGKLTDADITFIGRYFGPLQSQVEIWIMKQWEYYSGATYEHLQQRLIMTMQPSGSLSLGLNYVGGGTIDLANARKGDQVMLAPNVGLSIGRRLNVNLSYILQRLEVDTGHLFTVHLPQLRLLYHFNVRTFVRTIVQYQMVDQNPAAYRPAITPFVDPENKSVFTQFLFSYKVNPQTVLFLGYSDNSMGGTFAGPVGVRDLTRTDRTFFMKLGYAFVL